MATPLQQLLQDNKQEILSLADKHGVKNMRVFGSVARGEDTTDSDIDLLVNLESKRRISDVFALQRDLSILLQRDVDLLEENGLHWFVKQQILSEAISV